MIEVTDSIKEDIEFMVKDGVDGQEILLSLVEGGVVDREYPQLYREDGTFDDDLDNQIQDAIISYIEEQQKK